MYSERFSPEANIRTRVRALHAAAPTHTPVTASASRLWLAICLPQFPLEVALRGADRQRASVVAGQGTRQRVLFANGMAARLGIRPGLPLSAAHALGELLVLTRDPLVEERALKHLCTWAYQFSPLVSAVAGAGLVLEVQGSRQLFGGFKSLFGRLRRELRELGYRGALAIAPTPGAAMALATAQRQQVVTVETLTSALHELPIEALSLPAVQLQDLYAIGVRTVGDCGRLPRDGLGRRFKPEFLRTLDHVYGRQPDPRIYFEPAKEFTSRLELPWEVRHTQALHIAMMRLLHELTGYLRAQAATTRQLRWTLHQADQACHQVLGLGAPSRDIERFSVLTRERFHRETLRAPVRALELTVTNLEPDVVQTMSDLFQSRSAVSPEDWPQFTARLRARLGDAALQGIAVCPDHRPEQATAWGKWPVEKGQPGSRVAVNGAPHPVWLARRPIPLYERDGRLEWNGGLAVGAERERIESGWWDGAHVARDYFVATDPRGIRWWVYKELTGRRGWYLHGMFE